MRKVLLLLALLPAFAFSQNYFVAGTEWVQEKSTDGADPAWFKFSNTLIESTLYQGQLEMYEDFPDTGVQAQLIAYIKTDGEKVYARSPENENTEWVTVYDFGVQPGENFTVYYPDWSLNGSEIPVKLYMKCIEVNPANDQYGGLATVTVQQFDNEDYIDYGYPMLITWIKGIGSTLGVMINGVLFDYGGIGGGHLVSVISGGETVYSAASFDGVTAVTKENVKVERNGLGVEISGLPAGISGSLYTVDGRLIDKFIARGERVALKVSAHGLYILKTGNNSYKIVL